MRIKSKRPVLFNIAIKTLLTPSSYKVPLVIQMTQFYISYFSALQVLLLILCSLLGNTRDVTPKQMDGAVPIF